MAFHVKQEAAKAQQYVNLSLEVQNRVAEAARVIRNLPPEAERRFLSASERCSWPHIVQDWHAYGATSARAPRIPPTAKEVDRMSEVVGWVAWLASQSEPEASILWWSFGERKRTKALAIGRCVSRETIRRWRKSAVQRLVERFLLVTA